MTCFPKARSGPAALLAAASLCLGIAAAGVDALAHHPGSHAVRDKGGDVKVDLVVTVPDGCTTIARVRETPPQGIAVPRGSHPLTILLTRPEGVACTQAIGTLKREIRVSTDHAVVHVYVVAPDGTLASTERVPVR